MVAESWNKKLTFTEFSDINYNLIKNKIFPDGWDDENGKIINRNVNFITDGTDYQQKAMIWVDDNINGLFYCELTYTEGGTPIVHDNDKYRITFWFQLKSDADKFSEIANDEVAKKIMWSN